MLLNLDFEVFHFELKFPWSRNCTTIHNQSTWNYFHTLWKSSLDPTRPVDDQTTRRNKRRATLGARLHAKNALCAGLACGFPWAVSVYGGLTTRTSMSMTVVVLEALLGCCRVAVCKKCEKCDVTPSGNKEAAACLRHQSVCGERLLKQKKRHLIKLKMITNSCSTFGLECLERNKQKKTNGNREGN